MVRYSHAYTQTAETKVELHANFMTFNLVPIFMTSITKNAATVMISRVRMMSHSDK